MRLRASIALILILAAAQAIAAPAPLDVKQYMALRKKLCTPASLSAAKNDSAAFVGKLIEIRGRLAGSSQNDSGAFLIISTAENGSILVSTPNLPEDNPGTELACLVKVGEGSQQSLSDLTLVAWTYEVDLHQAEASLRAKPAPVKAAPTKSQPAASAKPTTKGTTPVTNDQFIKAYKNAIKNFNRKLSDTDADTIARSILGFSHKYNVDARLVCAVILTESHFRIGATSGAGAQGLGQLMPGTAAGLGVSNSYDPVENIYGSVRYIRSMLDRTSGQKDWGQRTWKDLSLALAAYNAGPGAVKRHGGIPPYRETQNYVRKVTSIYKQLCGVKG